MLSNSRYRQSVFHEPGGANTTTDALDLGIPVVALASGFLSGQTDRILLAERGLDELCATNVQHYVDIALRLLSDASFATAVRNKLAHAPSGAGHARQGSVTAADAILQLWQERASAQGAAA